jgi:hypothetical protein
VRTGIAFGGLDTLPPKIDGRRAARNNVKRDWAVVNDGSEEGEGVAVVVAVKADDAGDADRIA